MGFKEAGSRQPDTMIHSGFSPDELEIHAVFLAHTQPESCAENNSLSLG